MSQNTPLTLSADELRKMAGSAPAQCRCALKACQGWESVSDDRWPDQHMERAGTLRPPLSPASQELTFEEFHPNGTRYESPQAPIAPGFFPFNRCDVFVCRRCNGVALKYTEYGGYYVDPRVRLVDAALVVDR